MKVKAMLIAVLAGTTFAATAAEQTTATSATQDQNTKQAPIALSAAQMDQVVAGGNGPGAGSCTGTGIPKLDGTGPKYGKQ